MHHRLTLILSFDSEDRDFSQGIAETVSEDVQKYLRYQTDADAPIENVNITTNYSQEV
jgi:hypothetical protein